MMSFDEWWSLGPSAGEEERQAAESAWHHQQEKIEDIVGRIGSMLFFQIKTTEGEMLDLIDRKEVVTILEEYLRDSK